MQGITYAQSPALLKLSMMGSTSGAVPLFYTCEMVDASPHLQRSDRALGAPSRLQGSNSTLAGRARRGPRGPHSGKQSKIGTRQASFSLWSKLSLPLPTGSGLHGMRGQK